MFIRPIQPERFIKILKYLSVEFPKVFSLTGVKLLKHKIHLDLRQKTNLSHSDISRFLQKYINSPLYIKARKKNAKRYDLDGNECGFVTSEDIKISKDQMKLIIKRKKEKEQHP